MSIIFPTYRLARLSWGAVFAGVFLALIVYLILSVLGTAIGASTLAPLSDQHPLHGFGFGTGIWVMFTTVASILVGAYMAGRSAPSEGWLHGLLTWSIVTLVTVYLASVLVGGALGSIFNVARGGLAVAGQGVSAADTAHAVARGSWWAFALLIVGGIVAAAAGTLGARHQPVEEELVVDDREAPIGASRPLAGSRDVL